MAHPWNEETDAFDFNTAVTQPWKHLDATQPHPAYVEQPQAAPEPEKRPTAPRKVKARAMASPPPPLRSRLPAARYAIPFAAFLTWAGYETGQPTVGYILALGMFAVGAIASIVSDPPRPWGRPSVGRGWYAGLGLPLPGPLRGYVGKRIR